MTLKELAAEYRKSAEAIRVRINELREKADKPGTKYEERFWLNKRITELETIMAEKMREAFYLENYYIKAGEN